jgi:threonine dehydrogenase-like Zn-dependent dehydrogenase
VLPEDLEQLVTAETDGAGVPMVIEVSGNPAALTAALPLLAHEGTALVASWYGLRPVTLPLGGEFHRRRLTIRSTQVSTIPARLAGTWSRDRRRATARRLLDELPVQALATHVFPFTDAAAAYAAVDRGEPGLLHAAFDYR